MATPPPLVYSGGVTEPRTTLLATLLPEILRDSHRYRAGVEQHRPTRVNLPGSRAHRLTVLGREHCRDLVERAVGRAGFTRRHFDPVASAERLARVLSLADGLEATFARLGDEPSRRALIDVLKLRVLGPYHAPLRITPGMYRAKQAYTDRKLRVQPATFRVSDPWFSPISLYRAPVDNGTSVTLHCHSVDVVSVFLLEQYSYALGDVHVVAEPGDVVLDVGGCWADTALYFASLVGPTGKVYTFEFDPESLEVLRANLALNPELADRIEVVEKALWDRTGETIGFVQAGRMTRVVTGDAGQAGPRVETITLDDFVEEAGIRRVGFVKVDVEGVELNVLNGARRTLKTMTPRLAVSAYHHDDDLVRFPQEVASLEVGYRFYLRSASPVEEETVLFARAD